MKKHGCVNAEHTPVFLSYCIRSKYCCLVISVCVASCMQAIITAINFIRTTLHQQQNCTQFHKMPFVSSHDCRRSIIEFWARKLIRFSCWMFVNRFPLWVGGGSYWIFPLVVIQSLDAVRTSSILSFGIYLIIMMSICCMLKPIKTPFNQTRNCHDIEMKYLPFN